MSDEEQEPQAERPPPAEAPSLPPGFAKYDEFVKAGFEVGFQEIEDLRDMLERTANEDLRATLQANVNALTERLQAVHQAGVYLRDRLRALIDAPTSLSLNHHNVQEALMNRISALAPQASPEDLALLVTSYRQLPNPYFWWYYNENEELYRADHPDAGSTDS